MSMYGKSQSELTNVEHNQLNDVCQSFDRLNGAAGHAELLDNLIKKEHSVMKKHLADMQKREAELVKLEHAAIHMKDVAERKKLELKCKDIRNRMIEAKRNHASMERNVGELELTSAQMRQSVQDAVIDNARGLIDLCNRVKGRQEESRGISLE